MNQLKQFWALFKFQQTANPAIWLMPVVFGMPFYFQIIFTLTVQDASHPILELLLSNQFLIFSGFIGVMLLAPEMLQPVGSNAIPAASTEFLLTRAIDRPMLYRARVVFFYFLILLVPCLAFLAALENPSLQIEEYHKIPHQQFLDQIPGSIPAPADRHGKSVVITIPNGHILVEGYHLWLFLCVAIGVQVLILLIHPLKHRRFIFWAVYLVLCFGFLFLPLFGLRDFSSKGQNLSSDEILFLSFVAHQTALWILMVLALVIAQLLCERYFSRLEY